MKKRDKGMHKVVFMSGVLPEGTDVGYYVGGKVIFLFSLKLLFSASTNVLLLTLEVKSLEVTGWIYKGIWDLLSLLQHSGKLVVPFNGM
jgi:hypothetical protein